MDLRWQNLGATSHIQRNVFETQLVKLLSSKQAYLPTELLRFRGTS